MYLRFHTKIHRPVREDDNCKNRYNAQFDDNVVSFVKSQTIKDLDIWAECKECPEDVLNKAFYRTRGNDWP